MGHDGLDDYPSRSPVAFYPNFTIICRIKRVLQHVIIKYMDILTALETSYRSIAANKIRSILTTLGIIIGVAAVIILISVTQGAKRKIEEQVTGLGGKSLIIKRGKRGVEGNKLINLSDRDVEAIKKLETVQYAVPLNDTGWQVSRGDKSWFTTILGTSPDFVFINDWFTGKGSFFNSLDVQGSKKVCALGSTVAERLFGSQNPIHQHVRIKDNSFLVIGVMRPLGPTPTGKGQDDLIIIPHTTYKKTIEAFSTLEAISVSVKNKEEIYVAEKEIGNLIRERNNLSPDDKDAFYIRNQTSVINRIFTITKIMSVLLGGIASISLIVGGIGIMNIMLVSVKERTKEIGIRLAVGATEKDILTQFLVEAILLSSVGGAIGILVGIAGSHIATNLTNWPTAVTPGSILISFGFSAAIGIFFGLYPAVQASKMNPIQALRYE